MVEKDLRRLIPGLYRDADGVLYLKVGEFLRHRRMPDRPQVRAALLQQIRAEFGKVKIVVLEE
jgi:hypothetical protein